MKALVIGGTGPTGPFIVDGLMERGYEVTIFHSGAHEAEFAHPVEDLHGDPHFPETIESALGNRTWDLVVAQYGRLRVTAEFMVGKTPRFIGIGTAHLRGTPRDPQWGPLGRPVMTNEEAGPPNSEDSNLQSRIWAARARVMELHGEGHYNATYIGHPETYGPRQHSPGDWSVIKRILDGRRSFIIADGGLKVHQRAYGENCAQSVLLSVDHPEKAAGEIFTVGEQPLYTERQRIELICQTMGVELELISLPYALATPCHYMWLGAGSNAVDDTKIRTRLGYKELVEPGEAQIRTVNWIIENSKYLKDEWETQMEDTFDYAAEDELARVWGRCQDALMAVTFETKVAAHAYNHPKRPGQVWERPATENTFSSNRSRVQYY